MTDDYPTRADIQTTRKTLVQLRSRLGGPSIVHPLAYTALSSAVVVLEQLDQVPGLHAPSPDPDPEPEPEPQPTAAEVLFQASTRQNDNSPEGSILWAAHRYAKDHPEWFVNWHMYESAGGALGNAAFFAGGRGSDPIAQSALNAAYQVAKAHPELFGGAS